MPKGGLSRWFNENWVDLSRPKEGGGFEPCGRADASEGKYPKCVPASRAAKMTPEEIKSAIRRKRRAESTQTREDKKPIYVSTIKKKKMKRAGISAIPEPTVSKRNIPENMELYNRIKAEAKQKFDVYPSAYANGWLVQEYKRRGGTYKTISKHQPGKHKQATHAGKGKTSARNVRGKTSGGGSGKKAGAQAKFDKLVDERTEAVVKKLVAVTGDKDIAEFWKPKIREAIRVWQNPNAKSGDMDKPLEVDGIKFARQDDPTKLITATNILDMVSNTIGTEALTGISDAGLSDAFRNVVKHMAGKHDQMSHAGSRRRGSLAGKTMAERLTGSNTPKALAEAIQANGGITYNPKRNERRQKGVSVAISKTTEKVIPEEEFAKNGEQIVRDYVQVHAEKLAEPRVHLGAWVDKGNVYLDLSKVVDTVDEAANVGRTHDQIGVFDLSTFTTWYRHKSPTTGEYKYLATSSVPGYGAPIIDAIGKKSKPVLFIPAESIDEQTIPMIVAEILGRKITKDSPTVSDVHVPTIMQNSRKRQLKRKRMKMDAALNKHMPNKHAQQSHAGGRGGITGKGKAQPKKTTMAQRQKEIDALSDSEYRRYTSAPKSMGHREAMDYAKGKGGTGGSRSASPDSVVDGFKPLTPAAEKQLAKNGVRVPPAWTDVQVSADKTGVNGCLVRGVDAAGRVQSIYSAEHTAGQAVKKFARIKKAAKDVEGLDKALAKDALTNDDAASVLLMRELGMRPGSNKNTGGAVQAFGATTIRASHVRVNKDSVNFTFTGKKGVRISIRTKDPAIRKVVEKRLQTKSGRDTLFDTSEAKANLYIKSKMGRGYSAKDLRTLKGTTMAMDIVGRTRRAPRTMTEFKRMRNQVGDAVASQLGNTRALALKSYINPVVFSTWEAGL